ncbi:L-seryl-tRNA(Sec) selenium transferase [Minicystis rosea]|nr:L-seryl-tRNA(Sec) selenium transferase [Minicystis rosea]
MGSPLANLPRVDRVVAHPALDGARLRLGVEAITRLARRAVDEARQSVRGGSTCPSLDEVSARVLALAQETLSTRARPVINATGVVLHTNLGRAPLAEAAVRAVAASAGRYTSIEIDLGTGRRGARAAFAESGLAQLTGAEAALVVNNNAAATLLVLSALAMGRGVIVSRGELIEIGGGFRVPDVCARSGAKLIEVGTTNRTRLADYERALSGNDVAAILRVHQGNFRQVGFVERPSLRALADLAHARGVVLIEDLGGGAMIDLAPAGLEGEPTAKESITSGADVVCFSTDKVLGGPQGGAIVGRAEIVEKARRDPLARALRLGRLPLVALEATVALYLEGRLDDVPALFALRRPLADVEARAARWRDALVARGIAATVVDLEGAVGGGALAEVAVRSAGVALDGVDAEAVAAALRSGDPAAVGRIHEGRLLLDARTVMPDEDEPLLAAVAAAIARQR